MILSTVKKNGNETERSRLNRTRIIEAAVACFLDRAPQKATMERIAEQAGLDRKTVYRAFQNRTALFDAIAMQRVEKVVDRVKRVVDKCSSLEASIIQGTIQSLRLLRKDKIFMAIVVDGDDRGVEQYLIDPKSPIMTPMLTVWQEAFAAARAHGELRENLTDVEIATWLRGVHLLLLLREDLSAKGQAELLRKFVLPALVRQPDR